MVCDAGENLPMARLQLTALVDFALARHKGLDSDPMQARVCLLASTSPCSFASMQLATALEQIEAYCSKHFPSGLLQFENTKLASQQTKEALAGLKA